MSDIGLKAEAAALQPAATVDGSIDYVFGKAEGEPSQTLRISAMASPMRRMRGMTGPPRRMPVPCLNVAQFLSPRLIC